METSDHEAPSEQIAALTSKQLEVLELVVDRRTNKEIATILEISPSAVEQRLQSVRHKFGTNSRAGLARAYQQLLNTSPIPTGVKSHVDQRLEEEHDHPISGDDSQLSDDRFASGRELAHNLGRRRDDFSVRPTNGYDRTTNFVVRVAALAVTAAALALLIFIVSYSSKIAP